MTQTQKNCYKFLKVIAAEEFSNPKIVCSYYLKTTLLWALEKLSSDYWSDSKIGERVLGLLDDLLGYLTSKNLPNYFIPEMNLLEGLSERDCQKARDQVSRVLQILCLSLEDHGCFSYVKAWGLNFRMILQTTFLIQLIS